MIHRCDSGHAGRLVFQLGTERSGSTWLANIFDAHAGVELFMEPFADYAGLFPDVPPRHVYQDESVDIRLLDPLGRLYRLKYPFLYMRGMPPLVGDVERRIVRLCTRLTKHFGNLQSLIQAYELLSLNMASVPRVMRGKKAVDIEVVIIKELRLNFKARLLAREFPDARVVVCVRDPGAQITSIMKLIAQGRLRQLQQSLPNFVRSVKGEERLREYRALLPMLRGNGDLEGRLILWWIVSNSVLLGDLRSLNSGRWVVHHEILSVNPDETVRNLFKWLGLDVSDAVYRYIRYSSANQDTNPSPVNTNRRSAEFARESLSNVRSDLAARIRLMMGAVSLPAELACYFVDTAGSP